MPAPTPTRSMPDVPPSGVWLVVGGPPPSDEAGCEGGGASARMQSVQVGWQRVCVCVVASLTLLMVEGRNAIPIKCSKGGGQDEIIG